MNRVVAYLMHKDISTTVVRSNESPAFCNIEPLAFASPSPVFGFRAIAAAVAVVVLHSCVRERNFRHKAELGDHF